MHSPIFFAAIATLAFLQVTPAPQALMAIGFSASTAQSITGGVVAGSIAGGIGAGASSRRRRAAITHAAEVAREVEAELVARQDDSGPGPAPEGVPQHNWDDCYNDGVNAQITITGPVGDNHIKIEGLPPSCMTLATVLDGDTSGGPTPNPCGTACLEYSGMTPEAYEQIRSQVNAEIINA